MKSLQQLPFLSVMMHHSSLGHASLWTVAIPYIDVLPSRVGAATLVVHRDCLVEQQGWEVSGVCGSRVYGTPCTGVRSVSVKYSRGSHVKACMAVNT